MKLIVDLRTAEILSARQQAPANDNHGHFCLERGSFGRKLRIKSPLFWCSQFGEYYYMINKSY